MYRTAGELAVQKRADGEARTRDLILTMDALYQLSYVGPTLASYRRRTVVGGPARIPGTTPGVRL